MDTDDIDISTDAISPGGHLGAGRRARPVAAKTFQCRGYGDCRMVFSRSEHLARHVRKHTGERPFNCHCGKQFSRLDNLRQHAQTVHAERAGDNEQMMRELSSLHATMSAAAKGSSRVTARRKTDPTSPCYFISDQELALAMKEEPTTPPTAPFEEVQQVNNIHGIQQPTTPVSPTGVASIPFGPTAQPPTPPMTTTSVAGIPFVPHPARPHPPRPQDLRRISTSNLARSAATPTPAAATAPPFSPSPVNSASPSPNSSLMARPASVMGATAGPQQVLAESSRRSQRLSPQSSPVAYSAGLQGAQVGWDSPVQVHPLSQVHSPAIAYFPSQHLPSGPQAAMGVVHQDQAPHQPDSGTPMHGLPLTDGLDGLVWSIEGQTIPAYTLDPTQAWDWESYPLDPTAAAQHTTIVPADYPRSPVDSVYSRRSTESSQTHPSASSHHPSPPSSRSQSADRTPENGPGMMRSMLTNDHALVEAGMTMPYHGLPPGAVTAATMNMGQPQDHILDASQSWTSAMTSQEMHHLQGLAAYYRQTPAHAQAPPTHMEIRLDPSPHRESHSVPQHSGSAMMAPPLDPRTAGRAAGYSAQLAAHQSMALHRAQHETHSRSMQAVPAPPRDYMAVDETSLPGSSSVPMMGGTFADYPAPTEMYTQTYAMPLQPPPARLQHGPPPARTAPPVRPSVQLAIPPRPQAQYPPASAGPGPAPHLPFVNTTMPYGMMPPQPMSAPVDGMGMQGFFEYPHPASATAHQHQHMGYPGPAYQAVPSAHLAHWQTQERLATVGSAPPHLTTFGMHHPGMHMSPHMRMPVTPPPLLSQE